MVRHRMKQVPWRLQVVLLKPRSSRPLRCSSRHAMSHQDIKRWQGQSLSFEKRASAVSLLLLQLFCDVTRPQLTSDIDLILISTIMALDTETSANPSGCAWLSGTLACEVSQDRPRPVEVCWMLPVTRNRWGINKEGMEIAVNVYMFMQFYATCESVWGWKDLATPAILAGTPRATLSSRTWMLRSCLWSTSRLSTRESHLKSQMNSEPLSFHIVSYPFISFHQFWTFRFLSHKVHFFDSPARTGGERCPTGPQTHIPCPRSYWPIHVPSSD